MKISRIAVVSLAATAALGLAACSSSEPQISEETASPGETEKISIVTLNIMSDATLQIAQDQGYFEEEGLEPEISVVANPPAALAAVQGGQADIGFSTATVFLNARSQGIPVQIAAAAAGFPDDEQAGGADIEEFDDTGIYVDPNSGLQSLEDFAGKTVALGGARNGQLEIATSYALKEQGVDPASVNWISLDLTSALESVKTGKADAAVLVRPFTLQAEDAGLVKLLAPQPAYFGPGAINYWVTSNTAVEQRGEAIGAFQRAMTKANEYANEHLDEALEIGLETAQLDIPLERAGKLYWPGTVTDADIERVNDRMYELGFLGQPADLTDAILTRSE